MKWQTLIEQIKDVALNLHRQVQSSAVSLAADTTDKKALILQGETGSLGARFSTVMLKIQQTLAKTDENTWQGLWNLTN